MQKKNFHFILFLLSLFIFPHCGKKSSHTKLGVDYYKMSSAELESSRSDVIAYRQALQHIDKALKQEERAEYFAHKATLLFLLGKQHESTKCFKKALSLPTNAHVKAEVLNNYACLIAKQGEREKALTLFQQLENDHDYLTPEVSLVNQAKIYYEQEKYYEAKQKLVRAVEIAPDYVDAHYYLGLVHYALKEYHASLRLIEQTKRLEPGHLGVASLQEMVLAACSS